MENIIKQAEHTVNLSEAKEAIEQLKDYIPQIVSMSRVIYTACLSQGYNETQSFTFAKEWIFKTAFPK